MILSKIIFYLLPDGCIYLSICPSVYLAIYQSIFESETQVCERRRPQVATGCPKSTEAAPDGPAVK